MEEGTIEPASISQRIRLKLEAILLGKIAPKDRVGPILAALFRLPLFFQRYNLICLIPRNVLILTTTGRRSGRPHRTPVEFSAGPDKDIYLVMAGWGGRTDWYRNICANPCVRVWLKGREWEARAERVPDTEVATLLKRLSRIERSSNRLWSAWAGFEIDGSDASFLQAAPHFPSFYLHPIQTEAG